MDEEEFSEFEKRLEVACAWTDYRRDYLAGVDGNDLARARLAFQAGWKAAREGDQSGVQR